MYIYMCVCVCVCVHIFVLTFVFMCVPKDEYIDMFSMFVLRMYKGHLLYARPRLL